ncbi:hypothetical protein VKT23_020690 [Stygiomarasmius scandens]|uniref:Uncharacterized protein n=1 Tax=Marasmiellus scandens TaxID=2682957 RepID=A0ABR1IM19_9AGAR
MVLPKLERCFFSKGDYDEHRRFQAQLQALSAHQVLLAPECNIPSPPMASTPILIPTSATTTLHGDPDAEILNEDTQSITPSSLEYNWQKAIDIRQRLQSFQAAGCLDPTSFEFDTGRNAEDVPSPEIPPLKRSSRGNSYVFGHLEWLNESRTFVNHASQQSPCASRSHFRLLCTTLDKMLEREINSTWEAIRREWYRQQDISRSGQERVVSSSTSEIPSDYTRSQQLFMLFGLIASVLHLICQVSLDHLQFVLGGFQLAAILQGADPADVSRNIPSDMRTVLNRFDFNPSNTREYACCPKCFKLYPMDMYPEFCDGTQSAAPSGPKCDRRLRPKQTLPRAAKAPVRTFQYNNIRQWIASLYN